MDNIILILIITVYAIYKIVDRVCETIEMQRDSEEYKTIDKLLDENIRLQEELFEKNCKELEE